MDKLQVEVWQPLDYTVNPGDRPHPVWPADGMDAAREAAVNASRSYPGAFVSIRDPLKSPPVQALYARGEELNMAALAAAIGPVDPLMQGIIDAGDPAEPETSTLTVDGAGDYPCPGCGRHPCAGPLNCEIATERLQEES